MATISRFEELDIWQLSFQLCDQINEYVQRVGLKKDYELKNQIEIAPDSIMDNIAKGFERGSRNEFINFLSYASC